MPRVVIDTNILYSLVGISVNSKVSKSNLCDYKLSITTASVIESIVKHRNDLVLIKKCLAPIINSRIELISVGHAPISNETLFKLCSADKLEDVKEDIRTLMELKILREAEFLRIFLIIVISCIFEVLSSNGYSFKDEKKAIHQLTLVKALVESNLELFLDYFKTEIKNGYDAGNEQQAALNAFQEQISMLLRIFHFNYHLIKTYPLQGNLNTSNEAKQALITSLKNDRFDSKFQKYIDNPIAIVSQKKNFSIIDKHIASVRDGIFDLECITDKSLNFMLHKLVKAYKDKTKIRKNDIFDYFIIYSLNFENTKIVTLDVAFVKMLKEVDTDSYNLCQSLGFVN